MHRPTPPGGCGVMLARKFLKCRCSEGASGALESRELLSIMSTEGGCELLLGRGKTQWPPPPPFPSV